MSIYFHGTKSKITSFTKKGTGKHGEGFYFTPDYNEACYFANSLQGLKEDNVPRVYKVKLNYKNLFDTMNPLHCQKVMETMALNYKLPKIVGGAKEHYYHLEKQLRLDNLNEAIKNAGFDGILYDFMGHVILFDESQIEILEEILLP